MLGFYACPFKNAKILYAPYRNYDFQKRITRFFKVRGVYVIPSVAKNLSFSPAPREILRLKAQDDRQLREL